MPFGAAPLQPIKQQHLIAGIASMAASTPFSPPRLGPVPSEHGPHASHAPGHQPPYRVPLDIAAHLGPDGGSMFHAGVTRSHHFSHHSANSFDRPPVQSPISNQVPNHSPQQTRAPAPHHGHHGHGHGHARPQPPPLRPPPTHPAVGMLPSPVQIPNHATETLPHDVGDQPFNGPVLESSAANAQPHGQLSSKIVVDPPELEEWRRRLFNVDEMIILTHDQFETYFPHIDNVYSHRSTQRYKRKPFVSHYWDCRMKGRPPGTPKSDDPNKKKRKRQARERDLCDVKIKITEYLPGAAAHLGGDAALADALAQSVCTPSSVPQPSGLSMLPEPSSAVALPLPAMSGQRFWTIQRVNGNGGNGKGDGVAGPHKHTLAKSDEIKKNSVQRYLAHQEKDTKKIQKSVQRKATGDAATTAKKHSKENAFKLYSACFCPYSQRVWIALEAKAIPYQYCETDPFKKPQHLLEANPRGQVPAIRQGDWACAESAVILEYLEDMDKQVPLYPTDARLKANCRLWIDHINSRIVPAFYSLLRATEPAQQSEFIDQLQTHIRSLNLAADEQGPFFLGSQLCLVDIHFAPFAIRLSRLLKPERGWTDAMPGTRWQRWLDALEQNVHIRATTSSKELYLETMDLIAQALPTAR